jgi:predicted regulator of Ras-like GTPase activity (Roadblock/LC7/MglB family)
MQTRSDVETFNWLLGSFVRDTDGVSEAIVVSADGLLMARSDSLDRAAAERLAAIISGLVALARSASYEYSFESLKLVMIEMHRGFLLLSAISDGSCLGVVASGTCDVGLVGHEMTVLCSRFGGFLTPHLVVTLKHEVLG